MMKKTINIERQAFGSRTDHIGDNTLFYSAETSYHVRDVSGLFVDNPPRLSLSHASLVWRYNTDVDKYLLIHVQGSHVISQALGRRYTFRAGYEVSRQDMNTIDFRLTSLFRSIPRMAEMPSGRVEAMAEVEMNANSETAPSSELESHLLKTILDGQQLYISIACDDESLKNDGVFESVELKTLLATIDHLPVDKRRYLTFGFCVDDFYEPVLDGVLVIIYLKDCPITIPQGACTLSWVEATTTFASPSTLGLDIPWLGAEEPLLTEEQLAILRKTVNGTACLEGEEWKIWQSLGHQMTELKVDSWEEFGNLYERMDEETRAQLVDVVREASLSWSLEGLSEDIFKSMTYEKEQILGIQKRVLNDYLVNSPDYSFGFLFPEGLTKDLRKLLNADYLPNLQIANREETEKWYGIFQTHDLLSDSVKAAFSEIFCQHTKMALEEVMETLLLVAEKKSNYLQRQYLRKMDKGTLVTLLKNQPGSLIKNAELLLGTAERLPRKWKTFVGDVLQPAVMEAFSLNDSLLNKLHSVNDGKVGKKWCFVWLLVGLLLGAVGAFLTIGNIQNILFNT
jgi:hypothetical protein